MTDIYKAKERYVEARRFDGGAEQGRELRRWMGAGAAYIPPTNNDPREFLVVPTVYGPRDVPVGTWIVKGKDSGFLPFKEEAFLDTYSKVEDDEHWLVTHARRELSMFPDEDPVFIESIMNTIKGLASYRGHSGASYQMAVFMAKELLDGHNLLPLTDDPEEWLFHPTKENSFHPEDLWQNVRNTKAISMDGGKTYFFVDGPTTDDGGRIFHESAAHDAKPEIDPEDLESDSEAGNLS